MQKKDINSSERCSARYKTLATQIRAHCLRMTHGGKSGHVGSMLSMADLLAVLYEKILRVASAKPDWPERDRFILNKGHGGGAVYAVLAEKGFFPKEWLNTYYKNNGKLSGHISHHIPGVEFSTGSLGHGLSVAAGMALAAKHVGAEHRIFCLMSDGDCDEGSTWEAIMRSLPNIVVIAPSDFAEARAVTYAMIEHDGPVYYRCGYKKEPDIHQGEIDFKLGRAIQVQDGKDVTLIYTGTIGCNVLQAAELLKKSGLHCRVLSMHTVKPIDVEAIVKAAKETSAIVTVEEHNILGGLGGAVAEVLLKNAALW